MVGVVGMVRLPRTTDDAVRGTRRGGRMGAVTTQQPLPGDPGRFFLRGRLERAPRRLADRQLVGRYVASTVLTLHDPVPERVLTDRLAEIADDPVGLRRDLVEGQFSIEPPHAHQFESGNPLVPSRVYVTSTEIRVKAAEESSLIPLPSGRGTSRWRRITRLSRPVATQ